MAKLFLGIFILYCLNACSEEDVKPIFFYKAAFDPSMVEEVEVFMRGISKKWDLVFFEKDREQMKTLTQNQEAFFISLYFEGNSVLSIMNVGVGKILTLSIHDYGELSLGELEQLTYDVRNGLKTQYNIDLVVAEP